jgi:putative copper export protein
MHQSLLVLHLLAATIWIGGHVLLTIRFLPLAFKEKSVKPITDFEKQYEVVGIPALLLLVVTGIMMAYQYNVPITAWFSFSNPIEKVVSIKLILLFATLLLAIHARIFIIPKLTVEKLPFMAFHIVLITLVGISMMIVGTFVRFGGI